jgi:arylsulfatase A-like enzyme
VAEHRPNVLLVVLDAARRDTLTPYGAPPQATPAIAELAGRGLAHPRAYATASWTLPSHTAIFTGRPAAEFGLDQAPGGDASSVRPTLHELEDRLLAGVLTKAGYRCEGFSANLWASQHSGFDAGFERFEFAPSQRMDRAAELVAGGRRGLAAWAREGLRSSADDGARQLGVKLRDSIAQTATDERPAFWFVNLVEGHSPYLPPRPWNDLGPVQRVRAALDSARHMSFESICLSAAGVGSTPPASLQRMRHLHGRAVSYMDAWLAEILAALAQSGQLDNTLVIVTSDHGESFGEDGLLAHGFALGEQLIHVPLVLAGPGAALATPVAAGPAPAPAGGDQTSGAFSLAALPHLIATAAGLEQHPFAPPNGIAVARSQAICPPDDPRAVEFARKWNLNAAALARLTTTWTAATDGALKLLSGDDDTEALYDLRTDPDERAPQPATGPDADRLRAAIGEAKSGSGQVPATPSQPPPTSESPEADAETVAALERQMKLLGYM